MFFKSTKSCLQRWGERLPQYQRKISKCSARDDSLDQTRLLKRICSERYYISSEAFNTLTGTYGPLGTELKKNIIDQWTSAIRSRAYVFGISNSMQSRMPEEPVRIVNLKSFQEILSKDNISKEETTQKIQKHLKDSLSVRTSLLQGKLRLVLDISKRLT